MGAVKIAWAAIDRVVDSVAAGLLDGAGRLMAEEVRRRLGVEGSGVPSAPGEPPRKQTGELQRSVSYRVDRAARKVYVTVDHPAALYLEYGTRTMAPRPYLRQTLYRFASTFGARRFGGQVGARHAPGAPILFSPLI